MAWSFEHLVAWPHVPGCDDVACGDIDGDGRVDILCSQGEGEQYPIRWFRNLGGALPRWRRSERIPSLHSDWAGEQGWMGCWLGDFDGDGHLDVVGGAKGLFSGVDKPVYWFENVRGDGTEWISHLLPVSGDIIDHSRSHDFDGDGRDEIVVQKYHGGGVYYLSCPAPGDPRKTGDWKCNRIATGEHGLCLADLDGDGRMDVLVDNRWLRNPGTPASDDWPSCEITGAPTGVKNAAFDVNGDGRMDVVLSSEEGSGISWYEAPQDPRTGTWIRRVIRDDYEGVHTLWHADFDGDGRQEILTAEMHTRGRRKVVILHNDDGLGTRWTEHVLATTGTHNAIAVDIDGDGRPDVVGCNFAETENPLEVWLNRP